MPTRITALVIRKRLLIQLCQLSGATHTHMYTYTDSAGCGIFVAVFPRQGTRTPAVIPYFRLLFLVCKMHNFAVDGCSQVKSVKNFGQSEGLIRF